MFKVIQGGRKGDGVPKLARQKAGDMAVCDVLESTVEGMEKHLKKISKRIWELYHKSPYRNECSERATMLLRVGGEGENLSQMFYRSRNNIKPPNHSPEPTHENYLAVIKLARDTEKNLDIRIL